jgi:hypothetical protein
VDASGEAAASWPDELRDAAPDEEDAEERVLVEVQLGNGEMNRGRAGGHERQRKDERVARAAVRKSTREICGRGNNRDGHGCRDRRGDDGRKRVDC